jgi:hypothetical protein
MKTFVAILIACAGCTAPPAKHDAWPQSATVGPSSWPAASTKTDGPGGSGLAAAGSTPAAIPTAATLRPATSVSDAPPLAPLAPVLWHRTLSDARAKSTRLYVVINDTATPPKSPPPKDYAGVILGSHDLFGDSTVAEVFEVTPPAVAIVEGDRIIRRQNAEGER